MSPLRRGPAHPLSRPHAAALCGWRGARAGLRVAAVPSTILYMPPSQTRSPFLSFSAHTTPTMSRGDTARQRICTPTTELTLHSEAGLLTSHWLLLLLLLCLLAGTWAHRTPRGIYTLTIHDSPHSSPSAMFLQLTLCDLHISVPTFRQVHQGRTLSCAGHPMGRPWATARPPTSHPRALVTHHQVERTQ